MRVRVARWHAAARVMQRRWRQRAAAFEQALIEKEWNALKRAEEEEAAAAARAEAERRASRDAFEAWAPYVNVELIIEEERTVECLHVVATVISAAVRGHAARQAVRQEHRWSLRERREEAKQARRDAREAQAWAVEQAKLKAKAAAAIAREKAEEDAKQQRARAAAQRKARAEIIAARERARAVEQVTQTLQHAFDRFADTSRTIYARCRLNQAEALQRQRKLDAQERVAREAEQREARAKQVLANRELKLAQEKARKVLAEVTTTHPSRPRTQAVFLDCFCAPIRIVVSESSPFTRWAVVGRRRRRIASSGRRRRRRTVRSTSAPTRGSRSTQSDTGSSAPRPSPSSAPQHSLSSWLGQSGCC